MAAQQNNGGGLVARYSLDRDIGARENQEDYVACVPVGEQAVDGSCRELIGVLSDGMGGHDGGEIASHVAVSAFLRLLKNGPGESTPSVAMLNAAQQANAALMRRKQTERAELSNMGCTLCAVWIREGLLYLLNVGDSYVFLLRDNRLYRLNNLHNHREDMHREALREGLNWAEVSQMESVVRYGARLTSYIGADVIAQADCPTEPLALQGGDVIMLASDGVLTLSDREIAEAMVRRNQDIANCAGSVIDRVLAKRKNHQDNVSVLVVHIDEN